MKVSMKRATDACKIILVKKYWPQFKILPKNWTVYSEVSNSFCRELMAGIRSLVPEGWNEIIFWHVGVVPVTREVYNTQRAERGRKMAMTAISKSAMKQEGFITMLNSYQIMFLLFHS